MAVDNSQPETQTCETVAQVQEGATEQIVWQSLDNDKLVIPVNEIMRNAVERQMNMLSARGPIRKMAKKALEELRKRFSERVCEFSTDEVHDGELVITVRPRDGQFDVQLALDLGELADELETFLNTKLDEVGGDFPSFLVGFRQETGDGDAYKQEDEH